jgi:branched-chain amino acid transport system substrate-binding protein
MFRPEGSVTTLKAIRWSVLAACLLLGTHPVHAAMTPVTIGITLPLTGADTEDSKFVEQGFKMAIDEANAAHAIPGYELKVVVFDTATATAGQYDPAQAATTARKLISDDSVVANFGPYMSGEAKAMAALLSTADLATISATATNPDLTDPKFASQFRPAGKPVFFRVCTTDAFQGPDMANYLHAVLHAKSVYVLDDSGAGGVGGADAFQARANAIGLKVLGRDRLDPKAADYTAVLTKIKALNPDAIFYGGVAGAGVKLAKQAYDIIPSVIKSGVDGIYGPDLLNGVGFPAVEGWYITTPAPHVLGTVAGDDWAKRYAATYGNQPSDYSAVAYDAGLVVVDALKRVAASGKRLDRHSIRDAIQQDQVKTLQGEVSFDTNGDVTNRIISVFRVVHDPKYPNGDVSRQFRYLGIAPPS